MAAVMEVTRYGCSYNEKDGAWWWPEMEERSSKGTVRRVAVRQGAFYPEMVLTRQQHQELSDQIAVWHGWFHARRIDTAEGDEDKANLHMANCPAFSAMGLTVEEFREKFPDPGLRAIAETMHGESEAAGITRNTVLLWGWDATNSVYIPIEDGLLVDMPEGTLIPTGLPRT